MERRLIPVNALIGMCTLGDVYPAPIANAGYRLGGLEVPVSSAGGKVVVDVLLFRQDANRVLACEAKSGGNIEAPQARRYATMPVDAAVQAAELTITQRGDRSIQPLYACLEEHVERILLGLRKAKVASPVLAIGDAFIAHHGAEFDDPDLALAFAEPLAVPGPPPTIIRVDEESPVDEFVIVVMPALVAAVAHKRRQISVPTLAEEALQHHAIYAKAARSKLTKKVERAARIICDRDPESFEFRDRTALRDFASILIHRSPETAARQGRTQSYQAIARRAGRKEPRRRRAPGEDQMALFDDLIDELSADARSDPAEPEEPT